MLRSFLVATIVAITAFAVGAKPCLAQEQDTVVTPQPNQTVEVTVLPGGDVTVVTPPTITKPSLIHAELGLKAGYIAGNAPSMVVMPNVGLTLRLSNDWFLRASAAGGLARHGSVTDFNVGLGVWVSDYFRLTLSGGQIVQRTPAFAWNQGALVGSLSADYFLGPHAFVGVEGFGGPSWDQLDQLSSSLGGKLNIGWRF